MVFLSLFQVARRKLVAADLRFSPSQEAAFKQSLEEDMLRFGFYGTIIGAVSHLLSSASRHFSGVSILKGSSLSIFYIWMVTQVTNLCVLATIWARLKRGYFSKWNFELIIVVLILANMCAAVFFNRWYGPKLLGKQPDDFWDFDVRGAYMILPMYIDTLVTAACLFVPIRTCVLWLLPASGVIFYAILHFVFPTPFPYFGNVSLLIVVVVGAMSYVGAYRNEQTARKEWRASQKVEHQERELLSRQGAASEMLERFCDAVVLLGPSPSFCILDANPRLASMLLYTDGQRLQGKSISSFIASDEDHSRMAKALQDEDASKCVINIHLRDATDNEFAVTAYFSRFREFGDAPHFVVGLVEPQERMAVPLNHAHCDIVHKSVTLSASSGGTSSLGEPASKIALPHLCDCRNYNFPVEAAVAWVDVWTPDLTVVQCNSTFAALCGPSSASIPLNHWIVQRHSKERLSVLADDIIRTCENSAEYSLGTMSIQPPGLSSMRYTATCLAHCRAYDEEQLDDSSRGPGIVGGVEMIFIFTDVRVRSKQLNVMGSYSRKALALPDQNRVSRRLCLSL